MRKPYSSRWQNAAWLEKEGENRMQHRLNTELVANTERMGHAEITLKYSFCASACKCQVTDHCLVYVSCIKLSLPIIHLQDSSYRIVGWFLPIFSFKLWSQKSKDLNCASLLQLMKLARTVCGIQISILTLNSTLSRKMITISENSG